MSLAAWPGVRRPGPPRPEAAADAGPAAPRGAALIKYAQFGNAWRNNGVLSREMLDITVPAHALQLVTIEAEILADDWINPDDGKAPFGKYAEEWINERPDLRPKTIELYRYLLRRHLSPGFGTRAMAEIKEPHVRRWRKKLLDDGVSVVTAARRTGCSKRSSRRRPMTDDPSQPLPYQGGWPGEVSGAASAHCRPGLRARRGD